MPTHRVNLADEDATIRSGARCARLLKGNETIFIHGDLGAGKTTFVRSILRTLNVTGTVRSPTYTLLETYQTSLGTAYHLDLYRIADPEELEYISDREIWEEHALRLVEWPEHGRGWLPRANLHIRFDFTGTGRIMAAHGDDELAGLLLKAS